MTEPIAYAALQVIPTVKNLQGNLANQLGGPLVVAGKKAGRDAGDAIASGLAQSKNAVEKATESLAKAQDKVADASGRVRVEQQKLVDLQNSGRASAGQLAAAEERVETARRKQATATRDATRVADYLATANQRVAEYTDRAGKSAQSSGGFFSSLSGKVSKAAESLGALGSKSSGMASTGSSMGDGFVSGFSGKIDGLASKGGPIMMALAGVAGIGLGAGAVLAKAVGDGMQMEKNADLVQARLGVGDETMVVIGAAAGKAFTNAWGESASANMVTAQMAIQGGLLNGEETAGEMQPVIEKLTAINELIGGDMASTTKAASVLFRSGLAKDASGAFDIITRAYQSAGDLGDDLIDSMKEYGSGWKNSGLSAQFSLGLINQSMELGVDNTDRGADAIREFGRRVTEEGDTIVSALDEIGLNGAEMYAAFKRGGPDAEAAFDQAFDKIRGLEDPVKRNQAAMALLGDTAGDFIGSFTQWDPSVAAKKFGDVAGAADKAMQTMGDNAASKMDAAKNAITQSVDGVKLSLAQGFSPALGQMADWVSAHQPEIIGFFTGMADAALATGQGVASFVSGSLRVLASLSEGTAVVFGGMVESVGSFAGAVGKVMSVIPGMGDDAKVLEGVASALDGFRGRAISAADGMRSMADGVDAANSKLGGIRETVRTAGENAATSAEIFRALGSDVKAIPGEKSIFISENSPEVQSNLQALNLKTRTLEDGRIEVYADTAEGQAKIDGFIKANDGRTVPIKLDVQGVINRYGVGTQDAIRSGFLGRDINENATGGYIRGPGTGTSDSILSWLSNGEYVVNANSTSKTRPLLEAINNGWVPPADMLHGMVPGFASGGMVRGKSFAESMDSATYLMGGFSTSSIDCSGMVAATVNDALGLPPFDSRMSTVSEGQWLADRGFQQGMGNPGDIRVGWYDNGGGANGHTAMTLEDGTNVESNGSEGVVIGGPTGFDDPMFDQHMFLPGQGLGGDLGGPAGAGDFSMFGDGGGGGASGGASGAGGGGGGASGGASYGGRGGRGVTEVFVVNFPSDPQMTNTFGQPQTDGQIDENDPAGRFKPLDAPQSAPIGGTGVDAQYADRARQAGDDFLTANRDQFLSDLGLSGSGGALTELLKQGVKVVEEHIHYHVADMDEAIRKDRTRQQQGALTWARR